MIDRNTLKIIGEAIQKIEDKNDDYQNDKTWQRLRSVQEEAFKDFAKQEIELSKTKYSHYNNKKYIDRINIYKDYLEFAEEKDGDYKQFNNDDIK